MAERLSTWQFLTEAELLAATQQSDGVAAGDLALAVDTEQEFVSVDPNVDPPVWAAVNAGTLPTAFKVSSEIYTLDNVAVFADGQMPVPGPSTSEGWHYDNSEITTPNKINWYFYAAAQNPGVITLAELEGQYALIQVTTITDPILFGVYTKPEGAGDAGSFYRSRLNYIQPDPAVSTPTPGIYLFHRSDLDVTNIYPGYTRVACAFDPATSNGPQAATEEILLQTLSTNSTAAQGSLSFEASQTGYQTTSGRFNFAMVANDYQPRIEVLRQGLNHTLREYDKLTWIDGIDPTNTITFPQCTAQGAMVSIIMPSGNATTELVLSTPAEALLGPDGSTAPPTSTLTYPAGSFAAGTVLTFTGRPTLPGQDGIWTLLANSAPPSSATETQTWAETLALGEKTDGVSPAIQSPAVGWSKGDPRDQLHWVWADSGSPDAELPDNGSSPDDGSTRGYTIPLYSEATPVDGSGGQVSAGVIFNGGTKSDVLVDVLAVANYGDGPGGANFNKYFHSRCWVNTNTGAITQFGPLEGDTAFFDILIGADLGSPGQITLSFNDSEPTATGAVVVRGVATVLAVSQPPGA